jgi:hypothetical protein
VGVASAASPRGIARVAPDGSTTLLTLASLTSSNFRGAAAGENGRI